MEFRFQSEFKSVSLDVRKVQVEEIWRPRSGGEYSATIAMLQFQALIALITAFVMFFSVFSVPGIAIPGVIARLFVLIVFGAGLPLAAIVGLQRKLQIGWLCAVGCGFIELGTMWCPLAIALLYLLTRPTMLGVFAETFEV